MPAETHLCGKAGAYKGLRKEHFGFSPPAAGPPGIRGLWKSHFFSLGSGVLGVSDP